MYSTPSYAGYNEDLLEFIPAKSRIVEVGCSTGRLGGAYLQSNPDCDYIGIEVNPGYAAEARTRLPRVLNSNIETFTVEQLRELGSVDCWIFGDVLEHLVEPGELLLKLRQVSKPGDCIIACIPNMQNWEVQKKLLTGKLYYQPVGLLDKTHLRWFTKQTFLSLLHNTGWVVDRGRARVYKQDGMEEYIEALKRFIVDLALPDPEEVVDCATVYQYVVLANFEEKSPCGSALHSNVLRDC